MTRHDTLAEMRRNILAALAVIAAILLGTAAWHMLG